MDMAKLISNIQSQVHENQRKALIVSPVSLISSIILYGRATGGVSFGMFIIIIKLGLFLRHISRQDEGYGRMATNRSSFKGLSH